MLNGIYKEIDDFTATIKEVEGCDKMLTYLNSGIYSTLKLLMFASKSFTLYVKVMLFLIIALTGFLLSVGIGAMAINSTILIVITLGLFISKMVYIMKSKNYLERSILNVKSEMENP